MSLIRPSILVSSVNLIMALELCTGMQSWEKREKRNEPSTQPCGAPVCRVRMEEVRLFNFRDWGLLVRMSTV